LPKVQYEAVAEWELISVRFVVWITDLVSTAKGFRIGSSQSAYFPENDRT